ncbi:sensor histidine kinase [Haloplanus halobius]|uniref:sensor histidine kinase n=1 Tax=Haloplanus halobius TaxID=2934938 RepID=UPI00200CA6DE|nr:HAMP domain-containing sensor histidine kinase [Haloplanus sp. XH21]
MRVSTESIHPRYGFYAVGWICFGLGLIHYRIEPGGLESVLELVMIVGLSVIVLYTGYELPDQSISAAGQWRALLLGIGVAVSFTTLAFAVWLTWSIDGTHRKFSFLLSFAASLGAAVGTRSSLYAVQSKERLAKTQELTKLLRINQRVLRHNLRNELSIALGYLGNIENEIDSDDLSADLELIRDHLEALLETTDRTRKIVSIWDTDDRSELDLTAILEKQLHQLRQEHPDVDVTSTLPAECRVVAHVALPLAIREVLTNAIEHNPRDVSVHVTLDRRNNGTVALEVADTGTGIPKPDLEAITIPEETPLAHTQGLGLWILYWTVRMSDGTVEFHANEPTGTVVSITLPAL